MLILGLCGEVQLVQAIRSGMLLTVFSARYADAVIRAARAAGCKARAHFKLETGLHRLKAILQKETFLHEEARMLPTGPEGYLVIGNSNPAWEHTTESLAVEIKKAAIAAEEADALGRLFDIDVLVINDGAKPSESGHFSLTDIRSISRGQLGGKPRKCLLCGEDAKACARSRAHSMDDLLQKINEILSDAGL